MSWDDRRRRQKERPGRAGLEALARAVSPGAAVVRARRLRGGLATATHLVVLSTPSGLLRVVVKRYLPGDGTAPSEWAKLRFAHGLAVGAPRPLAVDPTGAWFGAPALAMAALPGRASVAPRDVPAFVGEIARTLALIHAARASGAPAVMRGSPPWRPPSGLGKSTKVERALRIAGEGAPVSRERVVSHGDFHPGNLLWSRGRISGVVDWSNARLAPRAWDVAYCRADLAVLLGGDAPQLFLQAYGRDVPHLPVHDLMCGLGALAWGRYWTVSYGEQGAAGLTPALARRRASAFVRRALRDATAARPSSL